MKQPFEYLRPNTSEEAVALKAKHKELKKQVNEVEIQRQIRRGPKSWADLRNLKKMKLIAKDKLNAIKSKF